MWWHDKRRGRSGFFARGGAEHRGVAPASAALAHGRIVAQARIIRAAAALAIAALAGGCFQPLYGEQSPTGGPGPRGPPRAVRGLPTPAAEGTQRPAIAGGVPQPPHYRLA